MIKAAKYKIQKTSTCRATLFRCNFWSMHMFLVFHLACSAWPATKTFVAGWTNAARWLVDLLGHEHICCARSCEFDEKRATNPSVLLKVNPRSTFRNNFLHCATSWSRKVKNGKHRTKTCNDVMLRDKLKFFCISYFAASSFRAIII